MAGDAYRPVRPDGSSQTPSSISAPSTATAPPVPLQLEDAWRALTAAVGFCQRSGRLLGQQEQQQRRERVVSPPGSGTRVDDESRRAGDGTSMAASAADDWLKLLDAYIDRVKALTPAPAPAPAPASAPVDGKEDDWRASPPRPSAGARGSLHLSRDTVEKGESTALLGPDGPGTPPSGGSDDPLAPRRAALKDLYAVFVEEIVSRMAEQLPLAQVRHSSSFSRLMPPH